MGKRSFNLSGCLVILALALSVLFIFLSSLFKGSVMSEIFIWLAVGMPISAFALSYKLKPIDLLGDSPEIKTSAEVVSKTSEISETFSMYRIGIINTRYYVSFQFPDSSRKNFNVDLNTYSTIAENDVGMLTYKQNGDTVYFVSFQPQA